MCRNQVACVNVAQHVTHRVSFSQHVTHRVNVTQHVTHCVNFTQHVTHRVTTTIPPLLPEGGRRWCVMRTSFIFSN